MESGAGEKRQNGVKPTCHCEERSDAAIRIPYTPCVNVLPPRKRNGFPRPVTSVTGLGMTEVFYALPSLLPTGTIYQLATPFPSVRTGDCLAAARSRRGSDMPPACHSLPRRRFATLEGAALRGKTSSLAQRQRRTLLAPLLGELSRKRLRGRRSGIWSRGEKTERSQTNLSLRGAKRRGNPHPLYAMRKCTAAQKKKRIPTTSDVGHWSRNDRGFLCSAFSFTHWHYLSTGDPFPQCAHWGLSRSD